MNVSPSKFRFLFERDGIQYECKYSPDEWNNNVLNWNRSSDSAGIMIKYSTSFTFIKEDADYLRDCFNTDGVFAKVRFVVEEYDYETFSFKPYYSGDIDFYSYENSKNKVSIVTSDISYKASIDANLDTTYEIDIPNASDFVRYDGLRLKNSIKLTTDISLGEDPSVYYLYPSIFVIGDESFIPTFQTQNIVEQNKLELNNDLWFCKALKSVQTNVSIQYEIAVKIKSIVPKDPTVSIVMYIGSSIKSATRTVLASHKFTSGGETHNFNGSYNWDNLNITKGDRMFFLIEGDVTFWTEYIKTNIDNPVYISLDYNDRSDVKKDIFGLRPLDLLSSLVSKATDGQYNKIKSDLLTMGEVSKMLITSGNLIRGIQGAKIKTSLKDFFQAFKSMFGAAYTFRNIDGVETLEIENINYFYDRNTMITEVGDINDYSMKVKDNDIYNKLKIGYEDQTYDEVNGKKEFNTTLEFSINSKHNGKELNLVSPYRADMYGIEFTIIDYEQQETTDSDNDNDVFIIHTGSQIYGFINGYSLNRYYKILNSDNFAGDTAFNVYLSPKRCLLRQIEYIKSLFMFSGSILKFASSPKDYNVTSTGNIIEHSDINLDRYNYLFKPINHEFETIVPRNISELIEEGYRGYIAFINEGQILKGFIESISENPGRNKSQKWKLIEL